MNSLEKMRERRLTLQSYSSRCILMAMIQASKELGQGGLHLPLEIIKIADTHDRNRPEWWLKISVNPIRAAYTEGLYLLDKVMPYFFGRAA